MSTLIAPQPPTQPPAPATGWIERRAKLFEAGEYPDKGVTVSASDLALLAQNFSGEVPLLIEHADSPLQLGALTQVEAHGDELFGTVRLSEEADRLVAKSGARSLSLGLSPDLRTIREVSLVKNPRIASARLFSDGPVFDAVLPDDASEYWRRRCLELEQRQQAKESEGVLDRLLKQGKLVPAQIPFAQALLNCSDTIEFDGAKQPLRQLLLAMLERQPPQNFVRPPLSADPDLSSALMLPEEAEFYQRHFPGVSLKDIAGAR